MDFKAEYNWFCSLASQFSASSSVIMTRFLIINAYFILIRVSLQESSDVY